MNYSKHNSYKILTKKEKKFLNEWIQKLKDQFRSRELEQEFFVNIDATTFAHKDQIIQLFFQSDEFGSVPEILDTKIPKVEDLKIILKKPLTKAVGKLSNKDVYGRGAMKRWKKRGLITVATDSKMMLLDLEGQKYEVRVEGKKFRLVVPGQATLQLTKQGEQENAKVKESKVNKVRRKRG